MADNTDEMFENVKEYLESSQNTNEVCERSLIVEAFIQLNQKIPNLEEAKRRLRQVIFPDSQLVDQPSWVKE